MRLIGLFIGLCCLSTLGFAGTWSGYLVDSNCYRNEQTNVSSDAVLITNVNFSLRQCAANAKTEHFAIVLKDWSTYKLDAAGSQRAAAIVHNVEKRTRLYCVTVSGVRNKRTIAARSVSVASVRKQR